MVGHMVSRTTHDGRPGITAEYFRRLDESRPGRCGEAKTRRLTEDQVRAIVRDEVLAILQEVDE